MIPLILASASPRRQQILQMLGYRFEVIPADVDENVQDSMDPRKIPGYLAQLKATEVSRKKPEYAVLGLDTLVFLNGEVMGKPAHVEEAKQMLARLSGETHEVITGVCLAYRGESIGLQQEITEVTFKSLNSSEINDYIINDNPLDKAGSYGIQDRGARFVRSIKGCFYNVMGLPVFQTEVLLTIFLESINGSKFGKR